jgi:hypothetical protein
MLVRSLIILTSLALAIPACAQTAAPAPASRQPMPTSIATHPDWPAAKNPADVDTIEHLMASLYDVISGPAGQQRDWNRFRALFLPDGRMGVIRPDMPATADKPARPGDATLFTPDTYVIRDDPFFKTNGFFEHGIANRIESFGNLTSVWSTYESRHALSDAQPFARGINTLQIVHAQGRYWVASIMWDDERPGLTLPEKYLKP